MGTENDAILALLEQPSPLAAKAAGMAYAFTRSLMYHKFTGQPKQGFARRIMCPHPLLTAAAVARLGLRLDECEAGEYAQNDGTSETYYTPWFGGGQLVYEEIEDRMDRADYALRLAARTVPRYEWRSRYRQYRRAARNRDGTPSDYLTRKLRTEEFAAALLAELAGLAVTIAEARNGKDQR